jgi:hypothetical protein
MNMENDTQSESESASAIDARLSDGRRQRKLLRDLKLELLGAAIGKSDGSNPYDSKLGKPAQDVWKQRRHA